jgi:hypothetical protein
MVNLKLGAAFGFSLCATGICFKKKTRLLEYTNYNEIKLSTNSNELVLFAA